ncbi:unnamed protein product [Didymodactylos carnosus]|uniref:Uncharacterized protein n=1 Tax=Didymodactylos carnosus TaxID=1234261 RepID=A0A815C5C1_9BILA|nr:unnamed protein product [Didymodactylos carnosus]CAF4075641.1 unnamed protein product [Didymodactylos carnosus]
MAGASSTVRNHASKAPIKLVAENNKLDMIGFLLEHAHNDAVFADLELGVAVHILTHKDLAEQLIQTRSIYDLTRVSHVLDAMKDIRDDPIDKSALEHVLDFVRSKSAEIKSRLDILAPTNIILDTLKVHITFNCQPNFGQTVNKLKSKCQNTKYQIAFLRTSNNQKNDELQQVIVIRSYHGEYPSIIGPIQKEVNEDFTGLDIGGITIKSSASNEGVPKTDIEKELFWNETIHCFDFHYRVL